MRSPRLSVADWCYFKPAGLEPAAYYRRLADLGYAAAEMVPPERRDAARAAGLTLLNTIGPGDLNRAEQHDANVDKLRAAIDDARDNAVAQVIVFSGNRHRKDGTAIDDDAGRRAIVAALRAVATHAERAKVVLTLEVFNTFDHPDYMADNGAFAFDVVRAVGSPAVKVLYDLYHMHRMGESVVDVALKHLPLIAHFHIAGSPKRDYPGEGTQPDYVDAIKRLTDAGYAGHWGMEWLPKRPALDELTDAARRFGVNRT